MRGKFIVLEGIDGAGKSLQSRLLSEWFRKRGQSSQVIKYPETGKPIGDLLKVFLKKGFESPPEAQFLLFAADMMKDMDSIRKLLGDGVHVILDRYIPSAVVYQGAQGLSFRKSVELAEFFGFIRPDFIFYLNVSPETSVKRTSGSLGDRFDSNFEFQRMVSRFYTMIREQSFMGNWTLVDAERLPEEVHADITRALA